MLQPSVISEDEIAVFEKTAGLASGNSAVLQCVSSRKNILHLLCTAQP